MNNNWYDLFISFDYGNEVMRGSISILNPLYVVLLMFLPATLMTFKRRLELPRWMGIELWKINLAVTLLLFLAGLLFALLRSG